MGRILLIALFVFCVLAAVSAVHVVYPPTEFPSETVAAPEESVELVNGFDQTGTLVFYPNNVGPVPYLFYQNQKGTTVAKALVFIDRPVADLSLWTGARVSVTGELRAEHVLVRNIAYVSGP